MEQDKDQQLKNSNSITSDIDQPIAEITNTTIDPFEQMKKKTIDCIAQSLKSKKETSTSSTIKTLVSQDKNRFKFDGFDLDLSYITPRIIAMGLPSTSVEALFRNSMNDVKSFFEARHPNHYKVYNLCEEKQYPDNTFYQQSYYPFKDHQAPPINIIKPFCEDAAKFLEEDPKNVIAIHCKAGKGRTGTFISCLLLYMKDFPTALECLKYYGMMRVATGKGVTVPSQIRYVIYFEKILHMNLSGSLEGRSVIIRRIKLLTVPTYSTFGQSCSPVFSIENGEECYKSVDEIKKETFNSNLDHAEFHLGKGFSCKGDIRIEFVHVPTLGKEVKMFTLSFNTFFIPEDGVIIFDKSMIDKACKDKKNKFYKENFKVEVHCIDQ